MKIHINFSENIVLHNTARGDTYIVQAELTAASPRTVSQEQLSKLYEVLDNFNSSCSLESLPFYEHFILMTDKKIICSQN